MLYNMYKEVSKRLEGVDFGAIWTGFARGAFALYDDREVVTEAGAFPVDDRFLGNTSIELGGVRTAIWRLTPNGDPDALAAGIAHEMFHSQQFLCGEVRFPDDLELLRLGLDAEELSLRALECAILSDKSPSLARWADARARRRAANPALAHQAELAETLEGLAEYAGLTALSTIAPEKREAALAAHRSLLVNPGEALADARRMAYSTGALLAIAARKAGLSVEHALGREERTLAELLLMQIAPAPAGDAPDLRAFAAGIAKTRAEKCRAFAESADYFLREARITGYDPMNMLRAGDFMLCERFIMLDGELLRGAILLAMRPGSAREVSGYFIKPASGGV